MTTKIKRLQMSSHPCVHRLLSCCKALAWSADERIPARSRRNVENYVLVPFNLFLVFLWEFLVLDRGVFEQQKCKFRL